MESTLAIDEIPNQCIKTYCTEPPLLQNHRMVRSGRAFRCQPAQCLHFTRGSWGPKEVRWPVTTHSKYQRGHSKPGLGLHTHAVSILMTCKVSPPCKKQIYLIAQSHSWIRILASWRGTALFKLLKTEKRGYDCKTAGLKGPQQVIPSPQHFCSAVADNTNSYGAQ